jgi:OOP family OmpA-OmpF porin/outer membrane immunogenic protein
MDACDGTFAGGRILFLRIASTSSRARPAFSRNPIMHSCISHAFAAAAMAAACAFAVSPVHAAESGAFVAGGIGHAWNDDGPYQADTTAWRIGAGYRWAITPGVAIGFEVGYADLGTLAHVHGTIITPTGSSSYPVEFSAKGPALGLDARFDIAPAWFVGARVGAQRANFSLQPPPIAMPIDDETGWYAGVRIGHDFSRAWSLGLGYDHVRVGFGNSDIDSDQLGVHAEYRF